MDDIDFGELLKGTTLNTIGTLVVALVFRYGGELCTSLLRDFTLNYQGSSSDDAESLVYGMTAFTSTGVSSEGGGGGVVAVFPENNGSLNKTDYDGVDVSAERIYDAITRIKELDKGTIIAKDSKIVEVLNDICSIIEENKEMAYEVLRTCQEVLKEIKDKEEKDNMPVRKLVMQ